MAPGRRRGGKGAKAKRELRLGDLVLAKVKGFPAWPAKIGRPEDWDRAPDPRKYFVQFFGTEEIAFVAPADIQAFTNEAKNKLSTRCQGKTVKYFAQAVKEICAAFEELQEKASSARSDDSDGQALMSDAHSADGAAGDGMSKGEPDFSNHSSHEPGLERSSHKQEEIDFRDKKSGVLVKSSQKRNELPSNDTMSVEEEKISTSDAVPIKLPDGEPKKLENGHKSKKMGTDYKRKAEVNIERHKIASPPCGSRSDLPESAEKVKHGVPRRVTSSGNLAGSTADATKIESTMLKEKKSMKEKLQCGLADDLAKEQETVELSSRKLKWEVVQGRDNQVKNEVLHCIKSAPSAEVAAKGAPQSNKKHDIFGKPGNPELKKSTMPLKAENRFASRGQTSSVNSVIPGDDDPPPAKRLRRTPDVSGLTSVPEDKMCKSSLTSRNGSCSGNLKSPVAQLPTKRRAVRIFDDDDEEKPKTPVHGGFAKKVHADLHVSDLVENSVARRDNDSNDQSSVPEMVLPKVDSLKESISSSKLVKESLTPKSQAEEMSLKEALAGKESQDHGKLESEKVYLKEAKATKQILISSGSPLLVNASIEVVDTKTVKTPGKVSGNSVHGKAQGGSNKGNFLRDAKSFKKEIDGKFLRSPGEVESENVTSKEMKEVIVSPRISPPMVGTFTTVLEPTTYKSSGKVTIPVSQKKFQAGFDRGSTANLNVLHHSHNQAASDQSKPFSSGERQKTTIKSNSHKSDSVAVVGKLKESNHLSGERLEAVREDVSSSLGDSVTSDSVKSMKHLIAVAQAKRRLAQSQNDNLNYSQIPVTDVLGGSPISASAVQTTQSSLVSLTHPDVGYHPNKDLISPSSAIHQYTSKSHPDTEQVEEARVSSGRHPDVGSLSGGTEAAVARDAFEGMIETLSRTKESIGRATRHAIDCAKYGIANEVVELLIQKLESEQSFHRRIDLFFLVDSITQCSHSQKGIAGASYIPIVQAALPRLLGAAAPPGSGARENRRQCLKVLRLWLERKILPETLLRSFLDDIGGRNDDTSAELFSRRPSRAERAVDDPIREMEGMLVDEYGSNVTFQLPGLLFSRVFEEEGEEDDTLNISFDKSVVRSPAKPVAASGELESCSVTPSDRRHCILEDVDGELEMEDVSGQLKEEGDSFTNYSFNIVSQYQMSKADRSSDLFSPLEGSPPLPLDPEPPTPPLPSSPPPPLPPPPPSPPQLPPPPSSPPPLPPSPPRLPSQSHPVMEAPMQPLPPQPLLVRQGNQLIQGVTNPHQGVHLDPVLRPKMIPQQPSCYVAPQDLSGFNSSRSLEYKHDGYTNSQVSHSNQQSQVGNVPLTQSSFVPPPLPQTQSDFSYSNATLPQHSQFSYPQQYVPTHAERPGRYGADGQLRVPSNELNVDNQRNPWMSGGIPSQPSGPPFAQEGYSRSSLDRFPVSYMSFQPSGSNTVQAGRSFPGHNGSTMIPSRPDMPSVNSWRPA